MAENVIFVFEFALFCLKRLSSSTHFPENGMILYFRGE